MTGYDIQVEGFNKEDAHNYILNKCKECDIMAVCNGADALKCQSNVDYLLNKFKKDLKLPFKKNSRILHITHTDLDGAGCAVLTNLMYDYVDFAFVEAGEAANYLTTLLKSGGADNYDFLLMTDLSFSSTDCELIELIEEVAPNKFFIIDHHKTALSLNAYEWALVANEGDKVPCATSLLADVLGVEDTRVRDFVELVRSYDVWDWVKTGNIAAVDLDMINRSLGQEGFIYAYSRHLVEFDLFFSNICKEMIKGRRKKIAEQVEEDLEGSFIFSMGSLTCAAVLCSRNGNEINTRLAEKYPEADFTIKVNPASGTISLRSREGKADVSEIAKFFGGGGHARASGVKLDTILYKKCLVQMLSHYNKKGILGRCSSCDNLLTVEDILPKTKEVKCKQCQTVSKLSEYYVE